MIPQLVEELREAYDSGITRSIEFREKQLRNLHRMFVEQEAVILAALCKDGSKSANEAYFTDLNVAKNGIANVLSLMRQKLYPQKLNLEMIFVGDSAEVQRVPHGVVLIIGTWNYVLNATVLPLIGAIAGGNVSCIKFSEVAPNSALLLSQLIPKYLDNRIVKIVLGEVPEATILLEQKFDFIYFVGNYTVGNIVMKAAAKNLTPVLLELGGKSPAIVDSTVDVTIAARRIIWSKIVNCGQTCIAADYVLVQDDILQPFLQAIKAEADRLLDKDALNNPNYSRIISKRHFDRLSNLLRTQKGTDGTNLVYGGNMRDEDYFIEPTVFHLTGANVHEQPIMTDEIFGPLLPIVSFRDINEAISIIKRVGKTPLAMYPFTKNNEVVKHLLENVNAGMVTVNDVLMQAQVLNFPFGGVGTSGIGAFHGEYSIDAFTRPLGVLNRVVSTDLLNLPRYPHIYRNPTAAKITHLILSTSLSSNLVLRLKFLIWKYGIMKFGLFGLCVLVGYYLGRQS